jgi:hypothetical protein
MADQQQQQQWRLTAQQRADEVWNRQNKEQQAQDQFDGERVDFLHDFATNPLYSPTITTIDKTGKSIVSVNPEFEVNRDKLVANLPKQIMHDEAFRLLVTGKERVYSKLTEEQSRQEAAASKQPTLLKR